MFLGGDDKVGGRLALSWALEHTTWSSLVVEGHADTFIKETCLPSVTPAKFQFMVWGSWDSQGFHGYRLPDDELVM